MNNTCPNCGFYVGQLPFCLACGKTLDVMLCEYDAATAPAEDELEREYQDIELGCGD